MTLCIEAWKKYRETRLPGDISRQPAFNAGWDAAMAAGAQHAPQSSAEYHQLRGAGWDIVDEAINTYDAWMEEDDYDFLGVLKKIMGRMKERRALYHRNVGESVGEKT